MAICVGKIGLRRAFQVARQKWLRILLDHLKQPADRPGGGVAARLPGFNQFWRDAEELCEDGLADAQCAGAEAFDFGGLWVRGCGMMATCRTVIGSPRSHPCKLARTA